MNCIIFEINDYLVNLIILKMFLFWECCICVYIYKFIDENLLKIIVCDIFGLCNIKYFKYVMSI